MLQWRRGKRLIMDIVRFNNIFATDNSSIDLFALKQLLNRFPYLEMARLVYLRELRKRDKELFNRELESSTVFFSDRIFAYLFINEIDNKPNLSHIYDIGIISSDYFALESSNVSKDSLRELANKLKKARLAKIAKQLDNEDIDDEQRVKNLIAERRFFEALKIMRKINLNNSEKSAYFAFQIKYLETILNFRN